MDMKLINSNLPTEIQNKILYFILSHPCAEIIKNECLNHGCEDTYINFETEIYNKDTRLYFPEFYFKRLNKYCTSCNISLRNKNCFFYDNNIHCKTCFDEIIHQERMEDDFEYRMEYYNDHYDDDDDDD